MKPKPDPMRSIPPIAPIGDRPFGYRLDGETAELWGFRPETPLDVTPDAPTDFTSFEKDAQETWPYWHWVLPAK